MTALCCHGDQLSCSARVASAAVLPLGPVTTSQVSIFSCFLVTNQRIILNRIPMQVLQMYRLYTYYTHAGEVLVLWAERETCCWLTRAVKTWDHFIVLEDIIYHGYSQWFIWLRVTWDHPSKLILLLLHWIFPVILRCTGDHIMPHVFQKQPQ